MRLISIVCLSGLFLAQPVAAERADRDKPVYLEADHTVEDVNRKESAGSYIYRECYLTGNHELALIKSL